MIHEKMSGFNIYGVVLFVLWISMRAAKRLAPNGKRTVLLANDNEGHAGRTWVTVYFDDLNYDTTIHAHCVYRAGGYYSLYHLGSSTTGTGTYWVPARGTLTLEIPDEAIVVLTEGDL